MKKHIHIAIVIGFFCTIIFQFANKSTVVANNEQDLLKIASIMHDENIVINEWSLHARGKMDVETKQEVMRRVKKMKEMFNHWDWSFHETANQWEAEARTPKQSHQQESLRIISTMNKSPIQTYIIYEVKGNKWGKDTISFINQQFSTRISDIFQKKVTIFSCMKGYLDDKIKSAISANFQYLQEAFHVTEIESLKEDTFISAMGYSPYFTKSFISEDKDMNIQLALRSQGLGGKTTVVVGTPIITIEY